MDNEARGLIEKTLNGSVKPAIGILIMAVAAALIQFARDILPSMVTVALMLIMFGGLFMFTYYSLPELPT